MSNAQRKVLRSIVTHRRFSRIEVQLDTGISGAALDRVLEALTKKGLLRSDEYTLTPAGLCAV
jgi:DNA-binding HxlR family transcriptional regulator